MMRHAIHRALYRHGFDTRCRNLVPARALRPMLTALAPRDGPVLLDVGCGPFGLGEFLRDFEVVGVDVERPDSLPANVTFRTGTITDLSFPDRSFPVVTAIDVLEHLSREQREQALSEIVRVAARAVMIAFPHGENAAHADAAFHRALERHRRPIPPWIVEHRAQPYPDTGWVIERIQRAAVQSGRHARVSTFFNEPLHVTRLVRALAARSDTLYAVANLMAGLLCERLPEPDAKSSYRAVVLAELQG